MAKQKNNARKDGRVCVKLDIGVDPKTGNRRRKSFYGATTKEAQAKADAFKRDIENGYDPMTSDSTLSRWMDQWYCAYKTDLSYGTAQNYKYAMQHIRELLGSRKLRDITQSDIVRFANEFTAYSGKYIQHMRTVLNQILRAAVANGLLVRNPADEVRWPNGSKGTHRALTDSEALAIQEHWAGHRAGIWMMLMLFGGLRRGEMLALEWNDVDIKTQEIHIRQAVHFEGNRPVIGSTKTAAGVRDVPMMEPLRIALEQLRFSKQSLYVCPARDGGLITQTMLRRGVDSFMTYLSEKSGQSISFRCHDLRHTFATYMYDADIDIKSAQYLLGHTDIKMTMQIYTHISEGRKKTTTDKLRSFRIAGK